MVVADMERPASVLSAGESGAASDSGADASSTGQAAGALSHPSSANVTDDEDEVPISPIVTLQVRVTDAQGLRLMRGGEIRLVLTLRAADDAEGESFGAKVTPWLSVPENEAPQWKARCALFNVPGDRCFQPDFVDSAYLHIGLWQRGHALPPDKAQAAAKSVAAPVSLRGFSSVSSVASVGFSGLRSKAAAALQGASSINALGGLLGGTLGATDRGELVGTLTLAVGQLLVGSNSGAVAFGGEDGTQWVQLLENADVTTSAAEPKVKGSLLLELATAIQLPYRETDKESPPAPPLQQSPAPPETPAEPPPTEVPPQTEDVAEQASEPAGDTTESGDLDAQRCEAPDLSQDDVSTDDKLSSDQDAGVDAQQCRAEVHIPEQACHTESECGTPRPGNGDVSYPRLDAMVGPSPLQRARPATQWRQPAKRVAHTPFNVEDKMNIFAANDRDGADSGTRSITRVLKRLSEKSSRMKPFRDQLRSVLDPRARRKRREMRKWRRWHEIFVALNEIERRLKEVVDLLVQAASSISQFGESHSSLDGGESVSAFLRDAGLYFRSEAEVPRRLEDQLAELEAAADFFRALSLDTNDLRQNNDRGDCQSLDSCPEDATLEQDQVEQHRIIEDLQVDVAVLLESVLMASQQAFAEYKKMHCRLELLATEYGSVCSLEIEMDSCEHAFLPLLADSPTHAITSSMPEQALHWAMDFSDMVGSASKHLAGLVRELNHRRRHLNSCSSELRDHILRRVCSGGELGSGNLS